MDGPRGISSPSDDESLFTLLVVGDYGVGKTSIISRYIDGTYNVHYKATKALQESPIKPLDWNGRSVRIQFRDVPGVREGSLTPQQYEGAEGAFVVVDITRGDTFRGASVWKEELDNAACLPGGAPIPAVVLFNKNDMLDDPHLPEEERLAFQRENGFLGSFRTSALENRNIAQAVNFLVARWVHKIR